MRRRIYRIAISVGLSVVIAGEIGVLKEIVYASEAGWKQDHIGWWYQNEDGSYQKEGWFQDKDKNWYYFASDGYMQTGWIKEKEDWYYLNPVSNGTMGKMQTGWILEGTSWYFADGNGKMQTGVIEVEHQAYYLNPISNGALGKVLSGKFLINGKEYSFDVNGAAVGNIPFIEKSYKINENNVEVVEKEAISFISNSNFQSDYEDNDDEENKDEDNNYGDDGNDNTNDNEEDKDNDEEQVEGIHFLNGQLEKQIRICLEKEKEEVITKNEMKKFQSFTFDISMSKDGKKYIMVEWNEDLDKEIYLAYYALDELDQMVSDLSYFINLKKIKVKGIYLEKRFSNVLDAENFFTVLKGKLPSVASLDIDMQTEKFGSNYSLDLNMLIGWESLKELFIDGGNINDISPLEKLPLLEKLDIRNNMISDITVLEELPHLKEVSLLGNPYIFDYRPVKKVEKLDVTLNEEGHVCIADIIDENNVTMDLFSQYTKKERSNIYADDLLGIEKFEVKKAKYSNSIFAAEELIVEITDRNGKIIEITASGNTAESYQGLVFCQNMTHFLTAHNFDEDITVFGYLTKMTHLQLGETNNQGNALICDRIISDYQVLLKMPQLKYLKLERCRFLKDDGYYEDNGMSVSNLSNLQNLEELGLIGCHFGENTERDCISEFPSLKSLEILNLSETSIIEMEFLKKQGQLKVLDVSGSKLSSLESLRNLKQLEELNLSRMKEELDLSPLSNLHNLQTINLTRSKVKDETPIQHVPNIIKELEN